MMFEGSSGAGGAGSVPAGSVPVGSVPVGAVTVGRFVDGLGVSPEAMAVAEVRRQLGLVRAARAVLDAREVVLHRRMTELSAGGCGVDPQREVAHHGGLRRRDVRTLELRGSTVEAAPVLGDLLASGATTAGHVDAVGHALAAAGDDRDRLLACTPTIVERAVSMDADGFGRFLQRLVRDIDTDQGMSRFRQQQRSTALRMWHDRFGMMQIAGGFDPELGAAIFGAIDRQVETMFHSGDREIPVDVAPGIDPNDHRRAHALHRLCTRTTNSSGSDIDDSRFDTRPARAEVVVHVDLTTLQSGLHERSVCRTGQGSEIPPAVARRLACEADIIPVVLSGDSVPLDVGRAKRLATVHQRRAIEARHTTCAIDGCDTPIRRCVIHHLTPWEHGGTTTLENLVPLCNQHHHRVHDDGWQLSLEPTTRHLSITLPGTFPGTPVPDGVCRRNERNRNRPAATDIDLTMNDSSRRDHPYGDRPMPDQQGHDHSGHDHPIHDHPIHDHPIHDHPLHRQTLFDDPAA